MGGEHSNKVGYGALDIDKTGLSWILLDWKVQVIKRPIYSEELKIFISSFNLIILLFSKSIIAHFEVAIIAKFPLES